MGPPTELCQPLFITPLFANYTTTAISTLQASSHTPVQLLTLVARLTSTSQTHKAQASLPAALASMVVASTTTAQMKLAGLPAHTPATTPATPASTQSPTFLTQATTRPQSPTLS